MRAALIALMLMIGSQAGAECGNLCDYNWWKTATTADVQAELDGGADVMARISMAKHRCTWLLSRHPCKYPSLARRWCRRHGAE